MSNQDGRTQRGFDLKVKGLEDRRSSLAGTRRPRRMSGTAEIRGARWRREMVGSAGVGWLRTLVGGWRAADLDLVEVAEHETAVSDPHKSESEMAACGTRHVS